MALRLRNVEGPTQLVTRSATNLGKSAETAKACTAMQAFVFLQGVPYFIRFSFCVPHVEHIQSVASIHTKWTCFLHMMQIEMFYMWNKILYLCENPKMS